MPVKTQTSKKPYLVHHRHSFKRLPMHHTSYSLLAFLLLFVGIFSLCWTTLVSGDSTGSYQVQATIPAPALTQAATITTPTDGQHVAKQAITASGYCPDHSYVVLQRNGVFAGSAMCGASTSWSILVSLHDGANHIQIQDYNITNQPGPVTAAITVYYDGPVTAEAATSTSAATPEAPAMTVSNVEPLTLSGSYQFLGVSVGSTLIETFTVHGGQAPYAISVDWGDGSSDVISQSIAGDFSAKHIYTTPGDGEHNSYQINLIASDSAGRKTNLQTTAVVTVPTTGVTNIQPRANYFDGSAAQMGSKQSAFDTFWRITAPVYGVSGVALFSFWLGQHRQLELLRRR